MSSILYVLVNDEVVVERVKSEEVAYLLTVGYAASPEQLIKRKEADTNNTGKLSDKEIKEAAKKAGFKIGRKSIATLTKELGL